MVFYKKKIKVTLYTEKCKFLIHPGLIALLNPYTYILYNLQY